MFKNNKCSETEPNLLQTKRQELSGSITVFNMKSMWEKNMKNKFYFEMTNSILFLN